jgi:primosomal protein N' (replication factor Y)
METFHNARTGKYQYLQLPDRIGARNLATVEIVDMRDAFRQAKKHRTLSRELLEAIAETCGRREQAIIMLNRRGYSTFLLCRSCGLAVKCPNCDVTLTYHREMGRLICHYCNHRATPPANCPECGDKYIQYLGEGTEQLEERVKAEFPQLSVARLDRDSTRRRGAFARLLGAFAAGEIDVLVGTQMIAKGHDFPNVTLVGVVSVDVGLALPDFRSAERTFQLLTQVAGRAGRGESPGRVIIQTYHPEHYAIRHALNQDYEGFYEHEIGYRRALHYPPFSVLINCLVRGEELGKTAAAAAELAAALKLAAEGRDVRVLGPAPAPLARLKGLHRWQVLLKAKSRSGVRETLDTAMANAAGSITKLVTVEIDPVSLL